MTTDRILGFEGVEPTLHERAWVAPGAFVIGDVVLGEEANVWFNCVLRGDVNSIRIGARTNVQDLTMVHVTSAKFGTTIGADVTIGHRAILHGCTVEDRCLIGMGATILDGAHIEEGCLIGAGALIAPGKRIPARSLVLGSPGKVVRKVTDDEYASFLESAAHYVRLAARHG